MERRKQRPKKKAELIGLSSFSDLGWGVAENGCQVPVSSTLVNGSVADGEGAGLEHKVTLNIQLTSPMGHPSRIAKEAVKRSELRPKLGKLQHRDRNGTLR